MTGRAAVTGANGYVGSLIVKALSQDRPVVRFVRKPQHTNDFRWSFESSAAEVEQALRTRNITHLVHCAWDMLSSSMAKQIDSSVDGSRRLIDGARQAGAEVTFISSISAFSRARSVYGRSKVMVENHVLAAGGTVLRLGLVEGENGGMLGNLRATVRRGRFVPVIGLGNAPQFLLPETKLAEAVRKAVRGEWARIRRPITIACPTPIRFRELLGRIAAEEGRRIVCVPIPWQVLFSGLRGAEAAGLKLPFRSDSVISFVYQDPEPDFETMKVLGFDACCSTD
jgi:nucleoside-diphosphate-sugar epimerase